ncbi:MULTISPECIES: hypothetical protein [Pseudoalteromonas]|uniref:hypothetical protein n=1 Tax=Pseudoalteromonas TaxID=53246 RepID=UPI000C31FF3F|nr:MULTISPECIES: hypothetical protein [Pseudoalteromonas]PKG66915.1 hypothetical protein CXF75_02930 [Pseudoalteromonas arctica]PKG72008.1 hypothetical protein CXF64_02500 [Pseudoalteromonas sp. GutCa3]|tara:strand:+ start:45 stop:746 length:702 start_codon:yes stop_codon:yes gene_type:complete
MRNKIIILSIFISFRIFAFQVEPMVADLQPLGANSQVLLRVTNTSENQLSVEISSFDLTINSQNKEKLFANDNDFMIIPMTAIIPPGESQAVIVKYIGEPILKASKSYRIEVKQLDVDLSGGSQSSIGVGYVFQTLYNVVPIQAHAQLVVNGKQQASEGLWKVYLENKGNKYIRLTKTQWIIESSGEKLELKDDKLKEALSDQFLLPYSSREVTLQMPARFDPNLSKLMVVHE